MRNNISNYLRLSILIFVYACCSHKTNTETIESDNNKNPYLGQKPPSHKPETFAPNLVTTINWEANGIFNPGMTEFYFLRQAQSSKKQEFVVYNKIKGEWKELVISERKGQPFISPDNKTLHLGVRYKERIDSNCWSELKNLGPPFNKFPIMRLTASAEGTYFFDEFKKDLTGDIRYSRKINGQYEEPKLLNNMINNGRSFHPFIAPDESFLIFDSYREEGFGSSDLYISYRQADGSWGAPINLGPEINTEAWEASATVTPDGKYLFFNRMVGPSKEGNVDIFWVDFEIVKNLGPNR